MRMNDGYLVRKMQFYIGMKDTIKGCFLVCVLLEILQKYMAIPIMNPLSWFMIDREKHEKYLFLPLYRNTENSLVTACVSQDQAVKT